MIQALTDYLIAESNCRIKIIYEFRGSSFDSFSTAPNSVSYHQIKTKSECAECIIANWVRLTSQKMKFFMKDLFGKCDQIRSFLWIRSNLLKKTLDGNASFFCAVSLTQRTFTKHH